MRAKFQNYWWNHFWVIACQKNGDRQTCRQFFQYIFFLKENYISGIFKIRFFRISTMLFLLRNQNTFQSNALPPHAQIKVFVLNIITWRVFVLVPSLFTLFFYIHQLRHTTDMSSARKQCKRASLVGLTIRVATEKVYRSQTQSHSLASTK